MRKTIAFFMCLCLMCSAVSVFAHSGGVVPLIDCDHSYGTHRESHDAEHAGTCRMKIVVDTVCDECGMVLSSTARYYTDHESITMKQKMRPDRNGFYMAEYCTACGTWLS